MSNMDTKTIPIWGAEQRLLQARVLLQHRMEGRLPSLQRLAQRAGCSVSTAAAFMNGNSTHPELVKLAVAAISESDDSATKKLISAWEQRN